MSETKINPTFEHFNVILEYLKIAIRNCKDDNKKEKAKCVWGALGFLEYKILNTEPTFDTSRIQDLMDDIANEYELDVPIFSVAGGN